MREVANGGDADTLTNTFREAFLALGSETPDNLAAMKAVEIGDSIGPDGPESGLVFASTETLLADVAHQLGDLPLPAELRRAFPDMTDAHWDAYCRLTTLIYSALTRNVPTDQA